MEGRKAVCASMIRYLANYTLNHFAQEEAFMKSSSYSGYEVHKQLHTNFKDRLFPNLINMLEEEKYSNEAIRRFIAVLSGWLSGHILIEDRAITGKIISRWNHDKLNLSTLSQIDREFTLFTEDLFQMPTRLVDKHYGGEFLGNEIYGFFEFFKSQNRNFQALFICDGDFVKHVVDNITNHICNEMSDIALDSFAVIAKSWSRAAIEIIDDKDDFEIVESYITKNIEELSFYEEPFPLYSLIWKVDSHNVGISIKELT